MYRSDGRLAWTAVAAVAALAISAGAQSPATSQLTTITSRIAARHRVRILVDPELQAPRELRAPADELPVDQALDALRSRIDGAGWRRIRLPGRTAATPDAARLGAVIRILDRLAPGHLEIDLPERDEVIRFARASAPAGPPPPPATGTSELFILYHASSTSDGRSPEARVAELERQQLALQGADEHLPIGVGQLLQLMQTLPPDQVKQLAGSTVEASHRLWDATPPEQRRSMMQRTMEVLQPLFQPPAARPEVGHGKGARRRLPVNRFSELVRITRELERKHDARIILDPNLFVSERPIAPRAAEPFPRALNTLVRPLAGVHWRKIRAPASLERQVESRQTAGMLAAATRSLLELEYAELAVYDAGAEKTTFVRTRPADEAAEPLPAPPLSTEPVFLVFDASPSAAGKTPAERLLNIQAQQFQEMFRMTPDQLTRSMEGALRGYETAEPAMQKRFLALPMMSGMMAGWFPRQAKENAQR
jgi:hypothetical protein